MRYFCALTSIYFSLLFVGAGCAHRPQSPRLAFTPHKDWLGLQLPVADFAELRKFIEEQLGKPLKNRGEAHITVVTPPEFMSMGVKIEDLENAVRDDIQAAEWRALCVGVGEKGSEQTYYVVVDTRDLFKVRKKIATLSGVRPGSFDPDHFYPHVTLGFTERDLHEQDGVIKDKNSCRFEIKK